ncbi:MULTISPECIES: hypothetical protein [unclassified Rhizobium]|uniref:hypothetical protein n=1 Tax=unclassified Rhizobium TaxID=2613769 RepID=UPI0011A3EA19|nr:MULTISPECIES: hypothetical protein [unclassified Rhizobium]
MQEASLSEHWFSFPSPVFRAMASAVLDLKIRWPVRGDGQRSIGTANIADPSMQKASEALPDQPNQLPLPPLDGDTARTTRENYDERQNGILLIPNGLAQRRDARPSASLTGCCFSAGFADVRSHCSLGPN